MNGVGELTYFIRLQVKQRENGIFISFKDEECKFVDYIFHIEA